MPLNNSSQLDDKNLVIGALTVIALAAIGVFAWAVSEVKEVDAVLKVGALCFGAVSSIVAGLLGVAVGRRL